MCIRDRVNGEDDYLTPWLVKTLNFFGIKDIEIISADQMALDYEQSIKDAEEQINKIS